MTKDLDNKINEEVNKLEDGILNKNIDLEIDEDYEPLYCDFIAGCTIMGLANEDIRTLSFCYNDDSLIFKSYPDDNYVYMEVTINSKILTIPFKLNYPINKKYFDKITLKDLLSTYFKNEKVEQAVNSIDIEYLIE